MDLPLRLPGLTVDRTDDGSSARLVLQAGGPTLGTRLELMADDVQELAGALCQWLADHGHAVPAVMLEAYGEDVDEDSRPPVRILPEHTR